MDCVAMLMAAYCEHVGVSPETPQSYLQLDQQQSRADGPQDDARAHLAGLLRKEAPVGSDEFGAVRTMYWRGQRQAEQAIMAERQLTRVSADQ